MTTANTAQNLRGSTKLLFDELVVQNASPIILDATLSLLEYQDRRHHTRLLFSTCSDRSSAVGRIIAGSKARTALIAQRLGIPTPPSRTCTTIRDAYAFLDTHHMIVTKPLGSDGGKGVSTNITTPESLRSAYSYAKAFSRQVIAQKHINGADVRLLTIGGRFVSAVIRCPASVTGDGVTTILELINRDNACSPRNDPNFVSILPIKMQAAQRFLGETIHDVPPVGQMVRVTGPANISLGGSLQEATHLVTPTMVADAERISQKLSLGICGVDMMWNKSAHKHYLIEVNATPGIDIHNDPYSGTKSDCVQRYVTWLTA